ncbi:uncharacterized protein LOC119986093 [Tripterygium wilfordii]|uniref:uncharacterized protein LOC119986093 n=1 Tax=Tripterygium wilfordii TaxID=458696 RepID=UPI0018F809C8|nr:uncharacterized protein LOC119986093 [Tripterygium wilfordii]
MNSRLSKKRIRLTRLKLETCVQNLSPFSEVGLGLKSPNPFNPESPKGKAQFQYGPNPKQVLMLINRPCIMHSPSIEPQPLSGSLFVLSISPFVSLSLSDTPVGENSGGSIISFYQMSMLTATTICSTPLLAPAKHNGRQEKPIELAGCGAVRNCLQFESFDAGRGCNELVASNRLGFGMRLQPLDRKKASMRSALTICAAAWNATCSASGQSQTATVKPQTLPKAPEMSPKLDDGGSGFPPRDDGGGGGGGGGGGNWSGGFFLFGFLAFLGFLKDNESQEDYRDGRRR